MHSGKFEFFVVTVHIIRSYQRLKQKGFKITRHTLCNTTDVTSGAIISYPSGAPEFIRFLVEIVFLDLQFCVQYFVDRCLSFFFWVLCCLSFELRILIALWYLQTLPDCVHTWIENIRGQSTSSNVTLALIYCIMFYRLHPLRAEIEQLVMVYINGRL